LNTFYVVVVKSRGQPKRGFAAVLGIVLELISQQSQGFRRAFTNERLEFDELENEEFKNFKPN
jgi:hypothetical protein